MKICSDGEATGIRYNRICLKWLNRQIERMRSRRIHVTGASGAGVTTLGRALAGAYAIPHHDSDDYFWLPTDPPYASKRAAADRIRLMNEMFVARPAWVLSGSCIGWAQKIEADFDVVIYVFAPTATRLERLRHREELRFGAGSTAEGGSRHDDANTFFAWAESYDDPGFDGRSKALHAAWLTTMRCPVIRVDGTRPTDEVVAEITRQQLLGSGW